MLITLYYLFGVDLQNLKMTMITNRKFCPACRKMIVDFIDIYQKSGAILDDFYGEDYIDDSITILEIPHKE